MGISTVLGMEQGSEDLSRLRQNRGEVPSQRLSRESVVLPPGDKVGVAFREFLKRSHVAREVGVQLEKIHAGISGEFYRMVKEQPRERLPALKQPFYPHGLRMVVLTLMATYFVVRFARLATDVTMFGWAILVSSFQVATYRIFGFEWASSNAFLTETDNQPPELANIPFRSGDKVDTESVEWVNAAFRKMWILYKKQLTEIAIENLQKSIDEALLSDRPPFLQDLRVGNLDIGNRALSISRVEKLPTRSLHDLVYHFDMRYDGDARLTLDAQIGVKSSHRFKVNVPVEVSSLDVDARCWVRVRLVGDDPFVGEVSVALVRRPRLDAVIKPFRVVDVMEVPGLSRYLRFLFTEDIPSQFVLPMKIDVLELVPKFELLRRDAHNEEASLAEMDGILSITLYEAENLQGTTTLGLSNPYCIIRVGDAIIQSKSDKSTSERGRGNPVWNQQFEVLVRKDKKTSLRLEVIDRYGIKLRTIGHLEKRLSSLVEGKRSEGWIPLKGTIGNEGRVYLGLHYRCFVDEKEMNSYRTVSNSSPRENPSVGSHNASPTEHAVDRPKASQPNGPSSESLTDNSITNSNSGSNDRALSRELAGLNGTLKKDPSVFADQPQEQQPPGTGVQEKRNWFNWSLASSTKEEGHHSEKATDKGIHKESSDDNLENTDRSLEIAERRRSPSVNDTRPTWWRWIFRNSDSHPVKSDARVSPGNDDKGGNWWSRWPSAWKLEFRPQVGTDRSSMPTSGGANNEAHKEERIFNGFRQTSDERNDTSDTLEKLR
uniref:C2 domain-containing protein n=1 Tax=Compsopogon caeruleus TaxID=31354 RepID=A0A7S1TIG0_9RHOD